MPFSATAVLTIIIFASAGREIEFSRLETVSPPFFFAFYQVPQCFRGFSVFFAFFRVFLVTALRNVPS